jgi:predicted esterase
MVIINKLTLAHSKFLVHGLSFLPESEIKAIALLTHGYTSHKGSILSWANKLSENNVACLLFDQPGHYLGSFNEVNEFSDFTQHAHELFDLAHHQLIEQVKQKTNEVVPKLILAGHSLGALTSLKARELAFCDQYECLNIAVGFGLNPSHDTHLFDTEFYQKTLEMRNQLVSPAINKDNMFKWIKQQKESLTVTNAKIHLISGEDDLVVGKNGVECLKDKLESLGNDVLIEKPKKLPHHLPENAASFVNAVVKKFIL